jgi:hypothetical protein
VEQGVVGQFAVGADPQPLVRLARALAVPRQLADVALVDRMRPVEPVDQLVLPGLEALGQRGQRLGRRTSGMGIWCSSALRSGSANEADMLKMAFPCWTATTRRVVNDLPSRIRSTS